MQKATFYILDKPDLKSRDLFVCKLIEKLYNNKSKIFVYTSNNTESQNIDIQLWTFRDISFIPHEIFNSKNANCQILISDTEPPPDHRDLLINLHPEIPKFYNQFSHILEVVYADAEIKKITRQHYKFYQQNNYELQTHEIKP